MINIFGGEGGLMSGDGSLGGGTPGFGDILGGLGVGAPGGILGFMAGGNLPQQQGFGIIPGGHQPYYPFSGLQQPGEHATTQPMAGVPMGSPAVNAKAPPDSAGGLGLGGGGVFGPLKQGIQEGGAGPIAKGAAQQVFDPLGFLF